MSELGPINLAYCGHYANDGAAIAAEGSFDEAAAYVIASQQRANAEHFALDGLHEVTVATRPIAAGEEVLVSYGTDYWLEHAARTGGAEGFFDVGDEDEGDEQHEEEVEVEEEEKEEEEKEEGNEDFGRHDIARVGI
jgi:hypothetical protein